MRALVASIIVLAATLAVVPAQAEDMYKWVDAKGVTNYSSAPPEDAKAGRKFDVVAPRVSVYTPDAAALRASAAAHAYSDRVRDDRIDRLERALAAERQATQYAAAADARAAQAAYEQCLAQRRVDCDSYDAYPVYAPIGVASARRRMPPFAPIIPLTGVTAGNVTDAIRIAGGTVNQTPGAPAANSSARRSPPARGMGGRATPQ